MARKMIFFYVICTLLISLVGCNTSDDQSEETRVIDEAHMQGLQVGDESLNPLDGSRRLSSESTTIPSDQFPHTQAVPIQHAQFDFILVEEQFPHDLTPENIVDRLREGSPQQAQRPAQNRDIGQAESNQAPQQNQIKQDGSAQEPGSQAHSISDIENRVIALTNEERRRNGLSDLQIDSALSYVAREKSRDMQVNHYFSHTSPTYGAPFDMIRDFGISFNSAGENIAMGQPTPEQVVQAWMDSPGHRANILNESFTHIGVGHIADGNYWTQMFINR